MQWLTALLLFILLCGGCASSNGTVASSGPVDVTGAWKGSLTDGSNWFPVTLQLQQTGSTVTGYVHHPIARRSGMLQGTIDGNYLRYRGVTGDFGADLTVTGDEMRGISITGARGVFRREK